MPSSEGRCLCGQACFRAMGEPEFVGFCYCTHCRRLSGAGRTPFLGFRRENLEVKGELTTYRDTSDAGAGIERAFCHNCGSRVLARPGSAPGFVIVYAGLLDDAESFDAQLAIHAAQRPSWEAAPDGLETFDGDAPSA